MERTNLLISPVVYELAECKVGDLGLLLHLSTRTVPDPLSVLRVRSLQKKKKKNNYVMGKKENLIGFIDAQTIWASWASSSLCHFSKSLLRSFR